MVTFVFVFINIIEIVFVIVFRIVFSILFLESRYLEDTKDLYYVWSSEWSRKNLPAHGHSKYDITSFRGNCSLCPWVSQLRTGKNVKCYTMMLQFPDKNYRTVSYRKVFNDEFPKKAQNESPMKMITVK